MVTHESQLIINQKIRHPYDYYNVFDKPFQERRSVEYSGVYNQLQHSKPWRTINKIATKIKNFIGCKAPIDIKNMLLFSVKGAEPVLMYVSSNKYNTVFGGKASKVTSKVFGNKKVMRLISTYFNWREYSCFKTAIVPIYENSWHGDNYIFFWERMMDTYKLKRILNARGKIFMWITDVELDYVRVRDYVGALLPTSRIRSNLKDKEGWWPNENLIEWAREAVPLRAV